MRVLITRFSALGDVAMTVPVVYDVCRRNPDVQFVMLTRPHPASLFINPPENLTIEAINTSEYKGIKGLWRLFRSLQSKYRFTHFVDLHDVLRTQILRTIGRLHGLKISVIDKGRREKRRLVKKGMKGYTGHPIKTTPQRYQEAFKKAGMEATLPSVAMKSTMETTLPSVVKKTAGEFWLMLAPFAAHKGKIYPLELLKEVVDEYAARDNTRIFIFGFGPDESEQIETLRAGRENIINMAALKLGMQAELALMAQGDVMLSMDSANMHLASLVGLRTVSIWGATHPALGFLGIGQKEEDAVQIDLPCRPCSVYGKKPCRYGDYRCLHGIPPADIIRTIDRYTLV